MVRLEDGPAKSMVYDTGKSYVWSLASDRAGNGYLGLGGTAAGSGVVMRVASDGKAVKLLETKELAVQALTVAPDGSIVAATSPDGKVYRVPASGGTGTVIFDPATTEEAEVSLDVATDGTAMFLSRRGGRSFCWVTKAFQIAIKIGNVAIR